MDYIYRISYTNNHIRITKYSCKETKVNFVIYDSYSRKHEKKELLNKIQNDMICMPGMCIHNYIYSDEEHIKENIEVLIHSIGESLVKDISELNQTYSNFINSKKEAFISDETLEKQEELRKNFKFTEDML